MSDHIPIRMLFESQGHAVVIETITRDVYRGKLLQVEANMNCEMQYVKVIYKNGSTVEMENIFIRGSKIVFIILPSDVKEHPLMDTRGPQPVKLHEPKNKSGKMRYGKGKNPLITPRNLQGTPQGPSSSKKKGGKNPPTMPRNLQETPEGSSTSRKKGGKNRRTTPKNEQGTPQAPITIRKRGG